MIKGVIFDLDDTLFAEKEYVKSGYRFIAGELSCKLDDSRQRIYETMMKLFRENSLNVFNRLLDYYSCPYDDNVIRQLVINYRNHNPSIHFFPDVLPCLDGLASINVSTGILTDGYLESQKRKVMAIGAHKYFKEIVYTDEFGKDFWKPHPKPFEYMREKMDVDYDHLLYVGDNPCKDFYISEILPIRTMRIYRKNSVYSEAEYFKGKREDFAIEDLHEIVTIVKKDS